MQGYQISDIQTTAREITPIELAIAERRLGTFLVTDEQWQDYPEEIRQIVADGLIVHCEYRWSHGAFFYEAINPKFRPLNNGEIWPSYIPRVDGDQVSWLEAAR